jgi:hypothetical protein
MIKVISRGGKSERLQFVSSAELKEILVDLLLGDLHGRKSSIPRPSFCCIVIPMIPFCVSFDDQKWKTDGRGCLTLTTKSSG